jgi:hypothetical protein
LWPKLCGQYSSDDDLLDALRAWRVVSKSWKEHAKTTLHWLAFNLTKGEVQNCKFFIGKEQMKHVPITYDIWCKSVCALHKSLPIQGVKNTLHLLSTEELKKVNNIHDKHIWGKGEGYCG